LMLEIFYRGFLFRKMNFELKIPFWLSALITTLFYIGPFFTNSMFTNNYRLLIGVTFYTLLSGFISCALTKKTKSLLPSYMTNLIINILRYLILV
jgi:membrane protease YdiL (CAAX protease family)